MASAPQIKIPATYMRGGTSKGVFFSLTDLPQVAQRPGQARDKYYCAPLVAQTPTVPKLMVWGGLPPAPVKQLF